MKRITCVLLILACLISFCPIEVFANQNDEFSLYSIDLIVDKDGDAYELSIPIIVKDGEFYIEPQNLADITRYQFSSDGDRLIYTLGLKSILIDISEQTLKVNLTEQVFSGSISVDGIHYLPMSEMLPWMNVQCYVSNDKLYIDSDIKSYWEIIEDFNPQDYLFDLADTYGETTGDVIGLCAISVFDCILDLGNTWKKVVPIDNGDTSLYEYEIYKECFREFAMPEVGTEAEVQKLLSEISEVVSNSSQFLNAYYTPIFTQETHDKIEALFGEDIAKGFEEWPTDATQITESLKLAKDALKYMKTGVLYARIAMADTTDYAEALRFIYMREGVVPPGGVELAASEAIIALESQAGAVADAAATMLTDIGTSILEDVSKETVEEAVQAAAGDTIFGSLDLYLDIIDATLSLVWPVNDAYAEITKMTVYQEIQYDALNAYYSISNYNSEVTVQDIGNARTSALIFLKTARKCFQAQQDTFDLYGGEGVLDWQIELINDKILEFQLATLSEENDTVCDKTAVVAEYKKLFHSIEPEEHPVKPQYDANKILSDWYFTECDRMGIEIAVLADVTHDGEPELITVVRDEEGISVIGSVYFVDANGTIQQIETLFGSDFHMGGFFGWYLKETETGYNLIQETFGMWQGYGEVDTTEYYLDTQGNRITVNCANVSSGDSEPVTDEAWEHYVQEGAYLLEGASVLYSSVTNIAAALVPLDESLILEQKMAEIVPLDESYTGEWVNGYISGEMWDRILTIHGVEDNEIHFDLFYYRLADFSNQIATMKADGTASFTATSGDYTISGELTFGDQVTVHVFDSNHPYVAADSVDYARPVVDTTTVGGILPEWDSISDSDLIWKYIDLFVGIVQANENVYEARVLTSGNDTIQYYPDDSSRTWANMEMVQVNGSWLQDSGYSFCVVGYPDKVIFFLCTAGGSTDSGWVYDWNGTLLENYVGQEMPNFILDCIQ